MIMSQPTWTIVFLILIMEVEFREKGAFKVGTEIGMLNIWWNFLFSTLLLKEVLSRKKFCFFFHKIEKVPSKVMGTFCVQSVPIAERKENIPRGWNYVTLRYSSKIEVWQPINLSQRLAAVLYFCNHFQWENLYLFFAIYFWILYSLYSKKAKKKFDLNQIEK